MRAQSSSLSAQQAAQSDFKGEKRRTKPVTQWALEGRIEGSKKLRVELHLSGGNKGKVRALASEDLFVARMETAPLREQAQVLLAELDRPAPEHHRVRALLERGARREGPAAAALRGAAEALRARQPAVRRLRLRGGPAGRGAASAPSRGGGVCGVPLRPAVRRAAGGAAAAAAAAARSPPPRAGRRRRRVVLPGGANGAGASSSSTGAAAAAPRPSTGAGRRGALRALSGRGRRRRCRSPAAGGAAGRRSRRVFDRLRAGRRRGVFGAGGASSSTGAGGRRRGGGGGASSSSTGGAKGGASSSSSTGGAKGGASSSSTTGAGRRRGAGLSGVTRRARGGFRGVAGFFVTRRAYSSATTRAKSADVYAGCEFRLRRRGGAAGAGALRLERFLGVGAGGGT